MLTVTSDKKQLTPAEFLHLLYCSDDEYRRLKREGTIQDEVKRVSGRAVDVLFQLREPSFPDRQKVLLLTGVEITGDIVIENKNGNLPAIFFRDCKLKNVIIRNCKAGKDDASLDFYFHHCSLKELVIEESDIVGNIGIGGESVSEELKIIKSKIHNLSVYQKSSIRYCRISKGQLELIILDECTTKTCWIEKECKIGEWNLSSCEMEQLFIRDYNEISELQISSGKMRRMELAESSVEYILINSTEIKQALEVNSRCTVSEFYIIDCMITFLKVDGYCCITAFSIENSSMGEFSVENFLGSLYLTASVIKLVKIEDSRLGTFNMSVACKLEAYITSCYITEVDLNKTTLVKESILSFSETSLFFLKMEEFSMLGNLYFRQIKRAENWMESYCFEEDVYTRNRYGKSLLESIPEEFYTKQKEFREYDKQIHQDMFEEEGFREPTIFISQSSLGKTEFTECPLADFRFKYNNSKITDCFIMGGSVPEKNIEVLKAEPDSMQWHGQKAVIYNQFRKIFEAQGDLYRATQFQAKWAEHQKEFLKYKRAEERHSLEKRSWRSLIRLYFNETSQDIFILWLNGKSNNHGESWLRPLVLLISVSMPIYLFYVWSANREIYHRTSELVGYFFEYLNPLHKPNFLNDGSMPGGLAIFIDFCGRLITAYLVYQFIAAFRKHGKKQ